MDSLEFEYRCRKIEENYKFIMERVREAAQKSGREEKDITVIAATKTVHPKLINFAISLGIDNIGENRVQELVTKYESLDLSNCSLHFIGHLQKNKVKYISNSVDIIQSVDSLELLKTISRYAQKNNKIQKVLIQVNIGRESTKSGVDPDKLEETLYKMSEISNVNICGLMSIPPKDGRKSENLKKLLKLSNLFIDKRYKNMDNVNMEFLSVGMSNDFYESILEGSNMVRIGTLLFGERKIQEV